jgi:alpha-glucosidase
LTRAGYAGIQRWSAVWTGDNSGFWEHLEMSLPQLMNLGLSGVPLAGVDIGGFWGNSSGELFARWMQLGAFYPFARGHSVEGAADKEPWVWGEDIERVCRASLELRYRLLPYLYTRVWEASQRGWPIFRPLLFHYPHDPATHGLADQVLFGEDLLVAPIVRAGARSRAVYLPDARWYDLWTDECFDGARSVLASADLSRVPVYVRGGSIVPFGPVLQHTDAGPLDPLILEVYPDAQGHASGALYEDDGESFDYERGAWSLTRFTFANGELSTSKQGAFEPPERRVTVNVHGS